jgi:hypothetical protein
VDVNNGSALDAAEAAGHEAVARALRHAGRR